MKYIYSNESCPKCHALMKKYDEAGIKYIERDSSRMKVPEDDIDREALVQASMQNMTLPVEVEI